jgi:hypothetical protein
MNPGRQRGNIGFLGATVSEKGRTVASTGFARFFYRFVIGLV